MLPLIGLLLVIAYVFLNRSGVLDDLADSLQKTRPKWRPRPLDADRSPAPDVDSERRLEIFEDFIEGLDPNRDIDEE
jgi:hypothetical protein